MITAAAALVAVPALASASTGPSAAPAAHVTPASHASKKHHARVVVFARPRTAIAGTPVRLSARLHTWRPPPTGTVTFWTASRKLCTGRVHRGWAHCYTDFRDGGTHIIRAVYHGDSRHYRAVGRMRLHTTRPHTATTVSASTYHPNVGQSVTLTATVHTPGRLTPSGNMRFTEGRTTLCRATLHGGTAHCSYAWKSVGNFRVTGRYSGDRAHISSHGESGVITVTQAKRATTTVIASVKPDSVPAGKPATVTVNVTTAGAGAPAATGTVKVMPAAKALDGVAGYSCTVTLTAASAGTGTCTITPPVPTYGNIEYDAYYSGDATHAPSSDTRGFLVIVPDVTATAVTFTPAAGAVGTADTITATITNQANDDISPAAGGTGTVTFSINGTAIAGCSNVKLTYTKAAGNTATCSYTPSAAGSVTVTATYSGDPGNLTSSGTGVLTSS